MSLQCLFFYDNKTVRIDPSTILYDNEVRQKKLMLQLPVIGTLPTRNISYDQSHTGLTVNITNIAENYKITAYLIKEGGRLDRMTPENVTASVNSSLINNVLTF
ncbi:hypothetical protein [Commensalibacter nepenthis]|uniref:Uncharacterized protein n=1 Tax=Commensalibacter nepenthis TaxID=3043872 RepID=A0ABT6Q6K7_9PROT|nr:hypothetical protein [Commensalibacter sp. TBRC 10068]MDI2112523.1 hypothetical protein [Commensalibacter sp. TBRC 10068]